MLHLLLFLALPLSVLAHSPSPEDVARTKEWQRLLYYKNHLFSGHQSAADGAGFFLSPAGYKDPTQELLATIAALEKGGGEYGKLKQPIHCAFPARKAFLEKNLNRKFPEGPCPKLEEFTKRLKGAGVSLVFATSYPNNPASMFGHSFLKISPKEGVGLLDWSLNYAAMVPDDENPFAFAFFGLSGGYQGQFALVPYYSKIEEYGYLEGRDIWEYDLNFTQEELNHLILAVWEIETNSHFLYYFTDENCSYHTLTLLEAAKPDWGLSSYFLHMIPGESIKRVTEIPGAVKAVRMRPSLERRLEAVARSLKPEEWRAFQKARDDGPKGLEGRPLQAYLLFLQAEKKRQGEKWAEEQKLREALKLRASQPKLEELEDFGGESSRPDLSHGAYQVGFGPLWKKHKEEKLWGAELSLRAAYHDLLDPDPGYRAHSEVLFPNLRVRLDENKFYVERLEAFSLVSLTPWNLVRKPLAWRANLAYERFLSCGGCDGLGAEGGAGAAWAINPERWTVWSMLGSRGEWKFSLPVTALPWVEFGSLFTLPTEGKILLELRQLRDLRMSLWRTEGKVGLSHPLSKNISLRGEIRMLRELQNRSFDSRLLAVHYF